jgi:hypothetical protein
LIRVKFRWSGRKVNGQRLTLNIVLKITKRQLAESKGRRKKKYYNSLPNLQQPAMSHDHPIRHSYFMNPTKKAYKHEKYFNKAFYEWNTMKTGNSTILAYFLQIVIVSHGYITLIHFRVRLQLMTSTQKNYRSPNIEIFASQISKHSNATNLLDNLFSYNSVVLRRTIQLIG